MTRTEPDSGAPRASAHFTPAEVRIVFALPHKILEIVLSERDRFAASIAQGRPIGWLVAAMLFTSVLFALPYGAVLGSDAFWRVAVLFLGSMLICFPSLHVVSAYIGCKIKVVQNLALALVITCVAAVFSFGFFPILWFLQETMLQESAVVTPQHISILLLAVSLLAGVGHLGRCFYRERVLQPLRASPFMLVTWQFLLVFITYRMSVTLELFPC